MYLHSWKKVIISHKEIKTSKYHIYINVILMVIFMDELEINLEIWKCSTKIYIICFLPQWFVYLLFELVFLNFSFSVLNCEEKSNLELHKIVSRYSCKLFTLSPENTFIKIYLCLKDYICFEILKKKRVNDQGRSNSVVYLVYLTRVILIWIFHLMYIFFTNQSIVTHWTCQII